MAQADRRKPKKPSPSFPLAAHPNGQWCKKICGRVRFFGVWTDPEAAVQRYYAQAGDPHAGREPRSSTLSPDELTVKNVCNEFLSWQKGKLGAGEVGARWFEDCRTILKNFARRVGKQHSVDDLRPEDSDTACGSRNGWVYFLSGSRTPCNNPL